MNIRVRRVAETGSTNADLLSLAREGEAEGAVLVADHQTAGRGRQGRSWSAPPGSSLLVSVLLRPPAAVAGLATSVAALALVEAVHATTGITTAIKWPNDVVVPEPGRVSERKLAGVLAEADWPARSHVSAGWSPPPPTERAAVVVGVGCNCTWPPLGEVPEELQDRLVALNHVTGTAVDRDALLDALVAGIDRRYTALVADLDRGPGALLDEWRARAATLGRRVRIDLGADDIEGVAVDVDIEGRLVVDTDTGERRTFAAGDVVHLR